MISVLVWTGLTAGMLAVLMRGRKANDTITYDEFVKEFLLKVMYLALRHPGAPTLAGG